MYIRSLDCLSLLFSRAHSFLQYYYWTTAYILYESSILHYGNLGRGGGFESNSLVCQLQQQSLGQQSSWQLQSTPAYWPAAPLLSL